MAKKKQKILKNHTPQKTANIKKPIKSKSINKNIQKNKHSQEQLRLQQELQQVELQEQNAFNQLIQQNDSHGLSQNQPNQTNPNIIQENSDDYWLCCLCTEYTYRIKNKSAQKRVIEIIVGSIQINGKIIRAEKNKINKIQIGEYGETIFTTLIPQQDNFINQQKYEQFKKNNKLHLNEFINKNKSQKAVYLSSSHPNIQIRQLEEHPWKKLPLQLTKSLNQTILLIGHKNSGKSTLCEYLSNSLQYSSLYPNNHNHIHQMCILDCDIGRNQNIPACVSLKHIKKDHNSSQGIHQTNINIWVGQLTPFSQVPNYLKALKFLLKIYRQKYFTSTLLVNTMGYLGGMGQIILFQIYNLVKPQITFIISNTKSKDDSLKSLKYQLQTGQYINRLYFSQKIDGNMPTNKTTTKFIYFQNKYCRQKPSNRKIVSLIDPALGLECFEHIAKNICSQKLIKLCDNFQIYKQQSNGAIHQFQWVQKSIINMQIVVIGTLVEQNLLEVKGLGYGWDSNIYCSRSTLLQMNKQIPVVLMSQGVHSDKNFYQMSQAKVLELQQLMGQKIPYILPQIKLLGGKGMRNYNTKK